jgi:hypothetical protein
VYAALLAFVASGREMPLMLEIKAQSEFISASWAQ